MPRFSQNPGHDGNYSTFLRLNNEYGEPDRHHGVAHHRIAVGGGCVEAGGEWGSAPATAASATISL